ncbi:MAG: radical SAM protein [Nanoarchaeota archaeon]
MNIAFITPPYSIEERYGTKGGIKKGFLPPLGLAYIATVLKEAGHKIKILDLPVYDYTTEDVKKELTHFDPGIIAMSAITPTIEKAYILADELKKEFHETVMVFGGIHPSLYPQETIKHPSVDVVVYGEAEYTFRELAEAIEKRKSLKGIKGTVYKDNKKKVITNGPRPIIKDLNELPIPSREFFDMDRYIPLPNQYKVLPATNMMTARGCPWAQCTFCFEAGDLKPVFRRVSPQRAVEEIRMLVDKYKIKEISFWDDVFLTGWILDFAKEMKKEKIDIFWSCYGYAKYITYDILKQAKEIGCWNIFYGIEAGNQEVLDTIKKGMTKEKIAEAVKWSHELGIETRGSFVLGLPGETPERARETIDFAIELDLDYAQFTLNTPFPSTEMWKTGDQFGTLDKSFDKYSVHNAVYVPHGYKNKEELEAIRRLAYRKFYFRPKFFWKHLKRVRSLQDIKKYAAGVKFLVGI